MDGLSDTWQSRVSITQWIASNASTQTKAVRKICLPFPFQALMPGRTTTWSFALSRQEVGDYFLMEISCRGEAPSSFLLHGEME